MKLVDEIRLIIEEEKIEDLCGGYEERYLAFSIEVEEINENKEIEESLKDYILENDYWDENHRLKEWSNKKEELKKYEIEEIKYWINDLEYMFHFRPYCRHYEIHMKMKRLIDKLRSSEIKVYRLIDSNIDDGILHEYAYYKGEIDGKIRCYDTGKERFIISCYFCD